MTRRDFQLIARTLKGSGADAKVVSAFAESLAGTNPKFDRARFVRESSPHPRGSTADTRRADHGARVPEGAEAA